METTALLFLLIRQKQCDAAAKRVREEGIADPRSHVRYNVPDFSWGCDIKSCPDIVWAEDLESFALSIVQENSREKSVERWKNEAAALPA